MVKVSVGVLFGCGEVHLLPPSNTTTDPNAHWVDSKAPQSLNVLEEIS